jgi:secondary thiamine-phosphate synthase enzyme
MHNDIELRDAPPNWPGGPDAWRAQEPINAHSHLCSMVIGNTATVPVTGSELALGTWQSVMLVELDGPRQRTVGIQVVGESTSGN